MAMVDPVQVKLVDGGRVECGAVLRSLADKRQVYDAVFDGRPAIVKVFLDRRRAKVHFQRELDGLQAFHNAGIAAMADRVIHLADGRIDRIDRNDSRVEPSELSW